MTTKRNSRAKTESDQSGFSASSLAPSARPEPFFLVGSPRSGTTLLQAILNRHPEICVPPETKVFAHYHRMPSVFRKRCVRRLEDDLCISMSDLPGRGANLSTTELLETAFDKFREQVGRPDVTLVGEKTPEHTAYLPEIADLFPSAKFVAIVRNGYHVAESLSRMPWLRCDLRAGGAIWAFYMRQLEEMMKIQPDRFCVVRFETLVQQPQATAASILEFLGADPDHAAECVEPNTEYDQNLFPTRERHWKGNALGQLNAVQSRPKQPLSDRQLRQIEDGSYDSLKRWGYLSCDGGAPVAASVLEGQADRHAKCSERPQESRTKRMLSRILVYSSLARTAVRLPLVNVYSEFTRRIVRTLSWLGFKS